MELADESPDGWPLQQYVASNCSSPSVGEISAVGNSSGNPFSLFYSPTQTYVHSNVIQSSRASNSWIASLRSNNELGHSSSLISPALYSRQHRYPLLNRHDAAINCNASDAIRGRSLPIGCLQPTSHSLPSSSFRHGGSLESIHRNQRLKQLAARSTSKVRSLSARESTAAAERWRYIQAVLQRRRQQNLEHRERFIRQPLDTILRQKAIGRAVEKEPPSFHSIASGRSILKRQTAKWRTRAKHCVHFDAVQQDDVEDGEDDDGQHSGILPLIPIPEESDASRNESPWEEQVDRRLPPLMGSSSASGIAGQDAGHDASQLLSPAGPSWVERQVAKVRQRKMWAFHRQQQQQQQQQPRQQPKLDSSLRPVLLPSVSMVVNASHEDGRDSSNEEEDDRSSIELENMASHPCLAWEVMLDKEEWMMGAPCGPTQDEPIVGYCGWPHFPVRLAMRIQSRQRRLRERKAERKGKSMNGSDASEESDHSFIRRKRFGRRLSIALSRQRKRKRTRRRPASVASADRLPTGSRPDEKTSAEEKTEAVPNPVADTFVADRHLTDAIPFQPSHPPKDIGSHFSSIHPDVVATIALCKESGERHTTVSSGSSSRSDDATGEADVIQTMATRAAAVSLETDVDAIVADVYYHLEGLIPVADVIGEKIDDGPDEPAGSAFDPLSACGRQEDIADESISDVAVDDGWQLIDQPGDASATTAATSVQDEAGTAPETPSGTDAIASDTFAVEQTEYRIAPPRRSGDGIQKPARPVRKRRPAYCTAWPLLISNPHGRAMNPVTSAHGNHFQDPISEQTVVQRPVAGISSDRAPCCLLPEKDPANPAEFVAKKTALDKKEKDAHNESKVLHPFRSSVPTQTERQSNGETKGLASPEVDERNDPVDDQDVGETIVDCQCLHRAVLTCLLPEAADTLANLELIRRQLKRARIRRQETEQKPQPLQVRRDARPDIDSNTCRP